MENKEVVEFASGTGLWTEKLATVAKRIVAIDAPPEVLTISHSRLQGYCKVHFRMANLFDWTPEEQFDVVFFSFRLSHVPEEQFEKFWAEVRLCLRGGGSAVFIDSLLEPASTAHDCPARDGCSRVFQYRLG
jgi:demethylmenaquinone methyltransferase/2-methoxy-6-polyprenyl-1,4-benzoquinol methylase